MLSPFGWGMVVTNAGFRTDFHGYLQCGYWGSTRSQSSSLTAWRKTGYSGLCFAAFCISCCRFLKRAYARDLIASARSLGMRCRKTMTLEVSDFFDITVPPPEKHERLCSDHSAVFAAGLPIPGLRSAHRDTNCTYSVHRGSQFARRHLYH